VPSINVEFTAEEFEKLKRAKPEGESWKDYMLSSAWIKRRLCNAPRKEWHPSWEFKVEASKEKPCHDCGFCTYGSIVEMFPLQDPKDEFSCRTFGHDCPVFYLAEPLTE